MSEGLLTIDTLLRGMTVGAEVLIALVFLSIRPLTWRRGLGAAFIIAAACYIINTSAPLAEAIGVLTYPVSFLSIVAPVIFWWFALSLFDDGYRMRWRSLIPLAQDIAVRRYHDRVAGYINALGLLAYEGRTVNGVLITRSGLLGACHLLGCGTVRDYLQAPGGGTPADAYGTTIEEYLSLFANYEAAF